MCVEASAGSATRERVQRAKCNRVSRRSAPVVWSLRSETGEETYSCRCPEIDSPLGYATRFWPGGAELMEGEKILQTSIYVARVDRPKNQQTDQQPISYRLFGQWHVVSIQKKKIFLFFLPIDFFLHTYACVYASLFHASLHLYMGLSTPNGTIDRLPFARKGFVMEIHLRSKKEPWSENRISSSMDSKSIHRKCNSITRMFLGFTRSESNELYFRSPLFEFARAINFMHSRAWYETFWIKKRKKKGRKTTKRDWDHFVWVSHS